MQTTNRQAIDSFSSATGATIDKFVSDCHATSQAGSYTVRVWFVEFVERDSSLTVDSLFECDSLARGINGAYSRRSRADSILNARRKRNYDRKQRTAARARQRAARRLA